MKEITTSRAAPNRGLTNDSVKHQKPADPLRGGPTATADQGTRRRRARPAGAIKGGLPGLKVRVHGPRGTVEVTALGRGMRNGRLAVAPARLRRPRLPPNPSRPRALPSAIDGSSSLSR